MQKLIIKTHSFVDVITNSSTELFVTNGQKSVEQVKELLSKKWDAFSELYNRTEHIDSILTVRLVTAKDNWWNKAYGVGTEKGDIIIISAEDNSIPYEFFDVIEEFFNATSYHLG